MVFSCSAHHSRAADIDVLDGVFQAAAFFGYGVFERIKVNHNDVDGADTVLTHNAIVLSATRQNATVHFGVQRFYPAVHHLGETGVIGHFYCGNVAVFEQAVSPAGRENFNTLLMQGTGKIYDACFVGDADQGAFYGREVGSHGDASSCG